MANVKITELTAATALAGTDVLPIVDVGADATKKVSVSDLLRNLPDGTASAPALAFADDQNSGILSPAENELAFATSGTQRLVVDSSGRVGIGVTSPAKLLEVRVTEDSSDGIRVNEIGDTYHDILASEGNLFIHADSKGDNGTQHVLRFGVGSSGERLRIDKFGRVGIGTTSPENNLHIADTSGPVIRLTNSTGTDGTYTGRISTGDAAGTFFAGINFFKHDTNDGEIRFRTKVAGTNQDTVTIVDGRVGIGTTSPDKLLHLAGADTAIIRLENTDTSLTADQIIGGLEFEKLDGSGAGVGVVGGLRMYSEGAVGESAYLTLSTASSSTNDAEALRIDSSGNVGIGKTSPASPLHVRGTSQLLCEDSATSNFFQFRTTGGEAQINAYLSTTAAMPIVFKQYTSERARIDSSGRLLVGTSSSPSAGAGQYAKLLSVGNTLSSTGDGRLALARGNTAANLSSGNGIGELLYTDNTGATFAAIGANVDNTPNTNDYPGRLVFSTTADGASSPTERMRLISNGQLLLNTTLSSSYGGTFVTLSSVAGTAAISCANSAGSGTMRQIDFFQGTSTARVGSIETTTTATAYNTSSDYRLKENVVDIADGIARIKQLQPKRFNFIADAEKTVDGFLAHEAQTVVPEAVTGTHNEVDDDNNPVYQGIDQSKLVPLLTAALQEAIAKIETLETKVAALEAQ